MHPRLFEIGPDTIYSYGVCLVLANAMALWVLVRRPAPDRIDLGRVLDVGIYGMVAVLIAGALSTFLLDFQFFMTAENAGLVLSRSASTTLGVVVGVFGTIWWYASRHNLPRRVLADLAAPALALAVAVVRIGCFLTGCCYGTQTDVPWAVVFSDVEANINTGVPLGVPLHPVQLYESVTAFAIYRVLVAVSRRRPPAGFTFWLFVLLYATSRFGTEFFRGDPRGAVLVLSTAQVVAIILAPVGLFMLWRLWSQSRLNAVPA